MSVDEMGDTSVARHTELHSACLNCQSDVVMDLLNRKGVIVDVRDKRKWTPLHVACFKGHVGIANILIERGAVIDNSDMDGWTSLHKACDQHNSSALLVRMLLDKGANIHARNSRQSTPLHIACANGNKDVVTTLIKYKADVHARNIYDSTPLHWACERGQTEIALILLKESVDIHARNRNQDTCLHLACHNGHIDLALTLVERGADVQARDNGQWTPLHDACHNDHTDLSMKLIEKGADIDARDLYGNKPRCSAEMISLFNNLWGFSRLAVAMYRNDFDAFKALIDCYDANSDVLNCDGWTVLHIGATMGSTKCVKYYLNSDSISANYIFRKIPRNSLTALDLAYRRGNMEIVTAISDAIRIKSVTNPFGNPFGTTSTKVCSKGHNATKSVSGRPVKTCNRIRAITTMISRVKNYISVPTRNPFGSKKRDCTVVPCSRNFNENSTHSQHEHRGLKLKYGTSSSIIEDRICASMDFKIICDTDDNDCTNSKNKKCKSMVHIG